MAKNRTDLPSRICGILSTIFAVAALALLMIGEWALGVIIGVAALVFFIGWAV